MSCSRSRSLLFFALTLTFILSLTCRTALAQGNIVAQYTFADRGTDGWFPFGTPILSVGPPLDPNNPSSLLADPKNDTNDLLISNRGATYMGPALNRSEERRVGKECRSRWWPYD